LERVEGGCGFCKRRAAIKGWERAWELEGGFILRLKF